MESANLQLFMTIAAQTKNPRVSSRMRERFLIRAGHHGARIAAPSLGLLHSDFLHFAALLIAICLFSGLGWRQFTQGSFRLDHNSTTPATIVIPEQLSAIADRGLVLSKAPIAGHSSSRAIRRNHDAPSTASILPSSATGEESHVAARTLLQLDTAFFPSQPRTRTAAAKLGTLRDVPVGYFSRRGGGLEPSSSTSAIWNPPSNRVPNQRVFHYSATLASISLQDDQAIFGLKPRVRDISLSDTLDSTRSR